MRPSLPMALVVVLGAGTFSALALPFFGWLPGAARSPEQTALPTSSAAPQPAATPVAAPLAAAAPVAANPPLRRHVDVRGLYLTGYSAGSDERFAEILRFMKTAGLNAMVIDAKDDDGHTSWPLGVPLAREIGAETQKISDIGARIRTLEENGIYAIARVVVYADPILGNRRPDLAINGGAFRDSRGIAWPDPYNRKVWEYNVDIARAAAAVGFREIQFDYIRFPEIRLSGYNYNVPVKQRTDAVEGFLRYAVDQLHPLGVFVSADVFGLTTSVALGDDMEIGQDYAQIAEIVDYIKPMVYPSHYAPWTYGVANPNQDPGKIVYESLVRAQKRTLHLPAQKHRPWIQDFDMGKTYTARDVEAQIRSLAEAGITQWLLWDPHNRYTRDANYRIAPPLSGEPTWLREYRDELRQEMEAHAGPGGLEPQ